MDQINNPVPFDPDFDSGSNPATAESTQAKNSSVGVDVSGVNPLMTFYAGLACSAVVFGLAGIIFLLNLIN